MSMSTWVIISWVFVAIFTGINIFVFIKLKRASEQMMKMAFPGANNMQEDLGMMQSQMQNMNRAMRRANAAGANPFPGAGAGGKGGANMDAQLRSAMEMLQQMQKKK